MPEIKPGDIIGFSGRSATSVAITLATYGVPFWTLSHVGIIGEHHEYGQLLYESTTLDDSPCVIQGKLFRGTQAQRLDTRIQGYKGAIWHYPLCRSLYDFERQRLNTFLNATIGTPYDDIGAFRSGGVGWSWIESWFHEQNLSAIFCSEWCCAAHTAVGLISTDNVSRWSPNSFVRYERREGKLLKPRRLK